MSAEENIPISTKWLFDSVGDTGRNVIEQMFMIVSLGKKGSGFLYKDLGIITNEHVVRDCNLNDIFAIDSKGNKISFVDIVVDQNKDLAFLKPKIALKGGLEIDTKIEPKPGVQISIWGYPLAYNGPAPLLSIGYISGFKEHKETKDSQSVKHFVVNGAFNPGNSGGPIFITGQDKVIGVVVNKHAPISQFLLSAIEVLAKNKSGLIYTAKDSKGIETKFAESQIVAQLLNHLRTLTQVMIGEAIESSELIQFIEENDIE